MTFQEVLDNQPAHYERILPGHPKPGQYTITNINPYKMHQRCAEKFRVGRICLAADAAHLCNPMGGLGLTGGFADVMGLADCLEGIAAGKADHRILDKYDEVRRAIYHTVVDSTSTENLYRVSTTDPDTVGKNDPFLSMCAAAKSDVKLKEKIDKVITSLISVEFGMLTLRRAFMTCVMTSLSITIVRLEVFGSGIRNLKDVLPILPCANICYCPLTYNQSFDVLRL